MLVLFSRQSFEQIIIRLNFRLNQDYYAPICENKDRTELECNGCYHLKKQLIETKKENSNQEKQIAEKRQRLYVQEVNLDFRTDGLSIKERTNSSFIESFPFLYSYDIFHPPRR